MFNRLVIKRRLRGAPFVVAIIAVMTALFAVVVLWPSQSVRLIDPDTDASQSERFSCQVAYVNDGDTFRCMDGIRVRLHAIAARESDETCSPGHPCPEASAASATTALRALVSGQTLACEKTGMSYNRVTAICWTPESREVNCAMLRSGTTALWERFNREEPVCRS
jgi:endonuclease YncB( thermonuclease family)